MACDSRERLFLIGDLKTSYADSPTACYTATPVRLINGYSHLATLPYQPPAPRAESGSALTATVILAVIGTPIWAFLYPGVISGLPRPMQGESVSIPFVACAVPYLAVPALLPAVFMRTTSSRILCVICLSALALGWYFGLGFDELLSKAWRRGL